MADGSLGDLIAGIGAGQAVLNRPALNAAVQQGQAMTQLHTAQTDEAFQRAQQLREENEQAANLQDNLTNLVDKDGNQMYTPSQAKFTAGQMIYLHGGAGPAVEALQNMQKLNAFGTVANPNATPAARLASDQALNPGANPFQAVGDQLVSRFQTNPDPNAPATVQQTPVSTANIADKNADAALHQAQADDPALFHPTGANNPNGGKTNGPGAITKRYIGATAQASEQLATEVNNVLHLPWGADSGVLGIGGHSGTDLMSAPLAALKNSVSTENTQLYNQAGSNMGRFMASIEKGGRPVTKTEGDAAFNAFAIQPGDTEITRLQKLASLSAHVQASLKSYMKFYKNDLDDDQLAYFKDLQSNFANMIPFSLDEVSALKNMLDKNHQSANNMTVGQFMVKHSMGTIPPNLIQPNSAPGTSPAAAGGATVAPADHSSLWN